MTLPAISSVVRTRVASSLSSKADHLLLRGQDNEAIAAYKDVIGRFEGASERPIREIVAHAFHQIAGIHFESRRNEDAIRTCNVLLERFGSAVNLNVKEELFSAFQRKALALYQLDRKEEALIAYGDWLARFRETTDPKKREDIAFAFGAKAILLTKLGRTEEAIAAYDDLSACFATDTRETVRGLLATAEKERRRLKGSAGSGQATLLINLSDQQSEQGNQLAALRSISEAVSILRKMNASTSGDVRREFASALTRQSQYAYACGDPNTGLRALEEATDLCRALAGDRLLNQAIFASYLLSLANHYDEAKHVEKALAVSREAVVTLVATSSDPRSLPANFSTQLLTTLGMYVTQSEHLKRDPDETLMLQAAKVLGQINN